MRDYFNETEFSKAVEILAAAPRIAASGCGHSGIICRHFAHLMCCIVEMIHENGMLYTSRFCKLREMDVKKERTVKHAL